MCVKLRWILAKTRKRQNKDKSDTHFLIKFGNRVRELRLKKFENIYDATGDDMPIKTRQHWQLIENGKKNINLTTLHKIAKTLEVKIEVLMKDLD